MPRPKNATLPRPQEKAPVQIKEKPPEEVKETPPAKPIESPGGFKRDYEGIKEIHLDRFSSDIQDAKKDHGWARDKPQIETHPHKHYYNTKGRRGESLTHTPYIYGHTHLITISEESGKAPVATCGPALVQSTKKTASGKKSMHLVPKWVANNPKKSEGEEGYEIMDTHSHTFTYTKSERHVIKS